VLNGEKGGEKAASFHLHSVMQRPDICQRICSIDKRSQSRLYGFSELAAPSTKVVTSVG
jgi:hypothetical protein